MTANELGAILKKMYDTPGANKKPMIIFIKEYDLCYF